MNFNLSIYFIFIFFHNFFIKFSVPLMGKIFLEIPNERSSHKKTKLKSGGIFFLATTFIVTLIDLIFNGLTEISEIIFICSLLSFIGLVDDLYLVSSKIRYLIQLLVSFLIINTVHPDIVSIRI